MFTNIFSKPTRKMAEDNTNQQDSNSRKGFASMPKEDVQEIAKMGGESRGINDNFDAEADKNNAEADVDFVPDNEKSGQAPELSGT
jgi:general stress protein YciG